MKIHSLLAMSLMAITTLCAKAADIPSDITHLYLVGEASPSGWDLGLAPEFANDGDGKFTWTGHLTTGQFKMTVSRSSWDSIVSSVQDNETMLTGTPMGIAYNPGSGDKDWKWYNNDADDYTLSVNLREATLTVTRHQSSDITSLYIIGSAVESGWDRDNAPELTASGNGIFSWTGTLNTGDFKFITSRSNWNSIVATEPDMPVTLNETMTIGINPEGGDKDYKWVVAQGGKYDITVNIGNMAMTITKATQTSITDVITDTTATEVIYYTPTGVRVSRPTSGIFIRVKDGVASKVKL